MFGTGVIPYRVPPIIVCVIALVVPYSYTSVSAHVGMVGTTFSIFLITSSVITAGLALRQFRRHHTTVDPRDPEKTSSLITTGIFKYSRNPIYVAMALLIAANGVMLEDWGGVLILLLFCAYIQHFQIIPEEHALHRLFGQAFVKYCQRTRRWL